MLWYESSCSVARGRCFEVLFGFLAQLAQRTLRAFDIRIPLAGRRAATLGVSLWTLGSVASRSIASFTRERYAFRRCHSRPITNGPTCSAPAGRMS